ncbi:MAG: hypothetical protein GY795_22150 [Desulfobacterales bacterium]|nr:hypothetical protein [Desulfobacterales bacterium]
MDKYIRQLLKSAILIWILVFFGRVGYSETLYVFYPSTISSQVMEKELGEACQGVQITVFGRYKDFKAKVGMDSPDAILTKEPVISRTEGYSIQKKGTRKGSADEFYVLLSADKKVDPANIANTPIGVFDILGRKGMKKFIGKYFNPPPRLKRVSKMEDMLQLLTFNMAEAVLIPEIYVKYFKEISKLKFVVTPVRKMRIGIVSLGVKKGRSARLTLKGIARMDSKTKALLEVDNWK